MGRRKGSKNKETETVVEPVEEVIVIDCDKTPEPIPSPVPEVRMTFREHWLLKDNKYLRGLTTIEAKPRVGLRPDKIKEARKLIKELEG